MTLEHNNTLYRAVIVMANVIMLIVILLNAIMRSVVAPI
jgi:hypothetical protein